MLMELKWLEHPQISVGDINWLKIQVELILGVVIWPSFNDIFFFWKLKEVWLFFWMLARNFLGTRWANFKKNRDAANFDMAKMFLGTLNWLNFTKACLICCHLIPTVMMSYYVDLHSFAMSHAVLTCHAFQIHPLGYGSKNGTLKGPHICVFAIFKPSISGGHRFWAIATFFDALPYCLAIHFLHGAQGETINMKRRRLPGWAIPFCHFHFHTKVQMTHLKWLEPTSQHSQNSKHKLSKIIGTIGVPLGKMKHCHQAGSHFSCNFRESQVQFKVQCTFFVKFIS